MDKEMPGARWVWGRGGTAGSIPFVFRLFVLLSSLPWLMFDAELAMFHLDC